MIRTIPLRLCQGCPGAATAAGLTLLAAVGSPGPALAHASERMVILTLPTGPFLIGAALAVFVSAVLGVWSGRLPGFGSRRLAGWRDGGVAGSWIGFAVLAFLLSVGIWGTRDPLENLLTLMLWTVIWVGLVLATVLFGDLWRPVAPWRGPVRLARRLLGRQRGIGLSRLGAWPAVLGYFGFAWLEIVSLAPADPLNLARLVGGYWLLIFVLAVAEGEDWLDTGEFMSRYFATVGKVAPLWRQRAGGRVELRCGLPGAQIVALSPLTAAEIAFVTLLIAGVSFDGISESFRWLAFLGINPLEFPGRSAVVWQNSLGLIATWAVMAGSILVALRLAGAERGPAVLSFLPIAAGYHLAHYLIALLTQGQYAIAAANDPFERGWALLGLPEHWVGFGFLSDRHDVWAIWTAQFALILGAHLLAVVLSLKLSPREMRLHLPLGVLMAAYTVFGLWLLSTPTAA